MVKHTVQMKTSSRHKVSGYELQGQIVGGGFLPATIQTVIGTNPTTGESGHFEIVGTLYPDGLDAAESYANLREPDRNQWQNPPHIAFANLRVNDPKSVETFLLRYGVLESVGRRGFLTSDNTAKILLPDRQFYVASPKIEEEQLHLRAAWETAAEPDTEDAFPLDVMTVAALEGLEVHNLLAGRIQIAARDLLTLISFLFWRDATTGKLGICGNPDCPAPYFWKKRRTQKYCEQGPCVDYAHRLHARTWWDKEGKKRREKANKREGRKR